MGVQVNVTVAGGDDVPPVDIEIAAELWRGVVNDICRAPAGQC